MTDTAWFSMVIAGTLISCMAVLVPSLLSDFYAKQPRLRATAVVAVFLIGAAMLLVPLVVRL